VHFDDTIASGESRIITLPTISVPYGPHTLQAQITLDGGEADGWNSNDVITHSFIVEESDFWTITVSPDVFGSETTWTLVDSLNTLIMFGGPYENSTTATYIQSGCVSVGCYELTIFDLAGDGMQYGGSYSLTSGNGDILAEGEDTYGDHFGSEELSTVCALPLQFEGCDDLNGNSICDDVEVQGCQESSACNFNPLANLNDESCTYPQDGYDCEGICLEDYDGDGICDENEIIGCQDTEACNYNPDATDSGECTYAEINSDCEGNSTINAIDIVESEVFILYPNPYSNGNGKLFIRTSSVELINLNIFCTNGRLVWEGEGTPYSDGVQLFIINESISPGTYIAHFGSSNPFSAIPLMIR
jgi:hypothetical protein